MSRPSVGLRAGAALVASFFAVLLGAHLVDIALADARVDERPADSLQRLSWHVEAQIRQMQALADQEATLGQAAAEARALLAREPTAGEAYTVLARDAAAAGQSERAGSLMRIAVRLDPRQRFSHAWLADHLVGKGDFAAAMVHFDQILRLSPRQVHTLMPALVSVAKHPEGRIAVADWIGREQPHWRGKFLASWATQAGSEATLDQVFDRLRTSLHPLTSGERNDWVERLVSTGRVAKAHYIWLEGLPENQRTRIGNVFDGGFELPAEGNGFGWRLSRVPGAIIRMQPSGGAEGENALMLEFQNRRVPFAHVKQMLALPAGRYAFRGRVRLDDLRSERGLRWSITCIGNRAVIMDGERFSGRRTWDDFDEDFTVPPEKCAAQWLQLRLDARSPAEQWVGGRAWFDSLSIIRR